MPIYEFHCASCGHDSEVLVRSTDWKGTPCPHCGSQRLDKKLSIFASAGGGEGGEACAMPAAKGGGGGCGCHCAGGRHRH